MKAQDGSVSPQVCRNSLYLSGPLRSHLQEALPASFFGGWRMCHICHRVPLQSGSQEVLSSVIIVTECGMSPPHCL